VPVSAVLLSCPFLPCGVRRCVKRPFCLGRAAARDYKSWSTAIRDVHARPVPNFSALSSVDCTHYQMKKAVPDEGAAVDAATTECREEVGKSETVSTPERPNLTYSIFSDVSQLDDITTLIDQELSEPYSVYTYRYFIYNWPQLCIMCKTDEGKLVGIIISKADVHRSGKRRGYIAMLVVDKPLRKMGIGAELVSKSLDTMAELGCDEAVLETELTNKGALRLYVNFLRRLPGRAYFFLIR